MAWRYKCKPGDAVELVAENVTITVLHARRDEVLLDVRHDPSGPIRVHPRPRRPSRLDKSHPDSDNKGSTSANHGP
jgi:hypothetical protein